MKKSVLLLLLALASAASLMAWYGWNYLDEYASSPFNHHRELSNVSKLTTDAQGNVYAITQGKAYIVKIDDHQQQQFRIHTEVRGDASLATFDEIAVDNDQYVYALRTILDQFGLYVIGEEILRFTPEGKLDQVLYQTSYTEKDNLYRIGRIQSFYIEDEYLYFYENTDDQLVLQRIPFNSTSKKPELVMHAEIPAGNHVADVYGVQLGSIVYSTKSGEIYLLDEEGNSNLMYPLDQSARTGNTVPLSPRLDRFQNVYFINSELNEVNRFHIYQPETLEVFLSGEAGNLKYMDISLNGQATTIQSDRIVMHSSTGEQVRMIEGYDLSPRDILFRWSLWAMLLFLVAIVVWILRIVYVHLLKRKISLIIKQIIVVVPLLICSIAFITNTVFEHVKSDLESEVNRQLIMLANNGQLLIDGDRIAALTSISQYMNDDYIAVEMSRRALFTVPMEFNREGLYSTIYKVDQGQIFKLFDDDDSIQMFEPIEMDEDFEQVLQGKAIANQMKDENGFWIYAMSPIYSSQGELVGIFETGKDMYAYERSQQELYRTIIKQIALVASACVLIFMIAAYWLLKPLRKLIRGVAEVAKGKWDAKVSIRTGDEVAELGFRFNDMAGKINKYIKHITSTNEVTFRFVPQALLKLLGKESILDLKLGDQTEQDMCIMVTNIQHFYEISKNMNPQENFNFLNSYLKRFGPVIRKHDGMISRYLGFGIMALFKRRSSQAIEAAIEMRKTLEIYNKHRHNSGYVPIEIGIALHKGTVMLGMIGEEQRMEGSVISDEVNLATNLEQLCYTLGASILITEQMLREIKHPENYEYRTLGMVTVKGKDEPIRLYDVYQGDVEPVYKLKAKTKSLFEQGVFLYQQGRFFDAREAFVEVIRINRWDKAAKHYFLLCDEYYQRGTTDHWNGVLLVS